MVEFLKKNWIQWFAAATIAVLGTVITNYYTVKRETRSVLDRKIEQKANIDYVNQQDNAIRSYVDTQDNNIQNSIKQHSDESAKATDIMIEYLKSIDRKVDNVSRRVK